MKGDASCHLPSDSYRHNYNQVFNKKTKEPTGISACASCGDPIPEGESVCSACKQMQPSAFDFAWGAPT